MLKLTQQEQAWLDDYRKERRQASLWNGVRLHYSDFIVSVTRQSMLTTR